MTEGWGSLARILQQSWTPSGAQEDFSKDKGIWDGLRAEGKEEVWGIIQTGKECTAWQVQRIGVGALRALLREWGGRSRNMKLEDWVQEDFAGPCRPHSGFHLYHETNGKHCRVFSKWKTWSNSILEITPVAVEGTAESGLKEMKVISR